MYILYVVISTLFVGVVRSMMMPIGYIRVLLTRYRIECSGSHQDSHRSLVKIHAFVLSLSLSLCVFVCVRVRMYSICKLKTHFALVEMKFSTLAAPVCHHADNDDGKPLLSNRICDSKSAQCTSSG